MLKCGPYRTDVWSVYVNLSLNNSMADATFQAGASPAPLPLLQRLIGVLTSPRDTYARIVAHPKWLGALVATTLVVAIFATLPMTTEDGQNAALEQQVRQLESFGVQINDEMYARMEQQKGRAPYQTAGAILIGSPIVAFIMAGILFAIFNAAMGGDASYKQVLSVLCHASVVSAVGQIFTGTLNYLRGAVTSATNLGVLLPMLEEASFVGRLAGMIDLIIIWWLAVLSIGIAVLYRRRTQPIAITLFSIYAVIALGFAAFMASRG
jgi:hypothetical protein